MENEHYSHKAGAFPALYHAHNSLDAEDIHFWLDLAARQGDPILELGCGTGRVLLPLACAGHRVAGLDNDPSMLAYLRTMLPPHLESRVALLQADLGAFHLGAAFSLIILPCNTYTMLSADQRLSALERVRMHLRPGGIFAASMPNPAFLQHMPRKADPDIEAVFLHPADGEPVQVSSAWRRTAHQVKITWIYDHLLPDGNVERFTFPVTQNILPVDALLGELRAARLQVRDLYGDFDGSPYSDTSTYLIVTVEKLSDRF